MYWMVLGICERWRVLARLCSLLRILMLEALATLSLLVIPSTRESQWCLKYHCFVYWYSKTCHVIHFKLFYIRMCVDPGSCRIGPILFLIFVGLHKKCLNSLVSFNLTFSVCLVILYVSMLWFGWIWSGLNPIFAPVIAWEDRPHSDL